MPKYTFECTECLAQHNFNYGVSKYRQLISSSHFDDILCNECQNKTLIRKVLAPFGKIERRKEEIIEKAKEEAKIITNKIREGNQRAIRDIFGEEK
jgi:hemolysin-activating ACP:hemolysin acyltransferase